ncbi:hypothetical protein OLO84_02455 [Campylobacter jejuni]|nr:hypothetical protein [Campylobacter jejuni]MCW1320181.1 hypothetical protein [Campylobacter jejuni]
MAKNLYEESIKNPLLPSFEEMWKKGLVKFEPVKPVVALQSFIKDLINNPLKTLSRKIEIYSTKLAQMQKTRN